MCPQQEMSERKQYNSISVFEMDQNGKYIDTMMIKCF